MAEDIKRMNYYDGLFLKDEDFQQDQNYHIRLHRLHTRHLHDVYGVVEGLKVEPIENTKKFRVREGIAISRFTAGSEKHAGEIVLADDDTSIDLSDATKYPAGSDFYITITKIEETGDMDEDKGEKAIHIIEKPKIEVRAISVPFDEKEIIVLGKVSIPAAEWVSQDISVDTSEVKTVNVGDGHSLDSADGGIEDVVYVDGRGRVGIGTTGPSAELDVNGTVKATRFVGDGRGLTEIDTGKWTDGANRAIYYNLGNVGIGTASPAGKLDVNGALVFNGNTSRKVYGASRAAQQTVVLKGHFGELEVKGRVIDWTGTNLHIGYANNHSAHYIEIGRKVFFTRFLSGGGTAETMRITGGKVGIGTTTPASKLDVNGTVKATRFAGDGRGLTGIDTGKWTDGASSAIYYNAGNVGIGTASPAGKLDVNGALVFNGNTSRKVYGASRAAQHTVVLKGHYGELEVKGRVIDWTGTNLHIGYANTHSAHFIEIGRKVGHTKFLSGGGTAETMRITGGKVGIGTASPTQKLEVSGTVKATKFLGDGSELDGISAEKWTDGASSAIYYNAGNVGIGTTTPGTKLHVNGPIRGSSSGAIKIDSGNGYVEVGPKNTSYSHFMTDRPIFYFNKGIKVNTGKIGSYTGDLLLRTENYTRMTVKKSNGYVGIGTTSPSTKLHVNGTITATGLTTNSLKIKNGTQINKIQGGTATIGSSGSNRVNATVSFPVAFTNAPKVIVTVRGGNYNDTFAVNTRYISTASFKVNVQRMDSNGGWGQSLKLDWFAFESPGAVPAAVVAALTGGFAFIDTVVNNKVDLAVTEQVNLKLSSPEEVSAFKLISR